MTLHESRQEAADAVFDRAFLYRNTMQNQELAAEVLGLFLIQLPAMLDALETAASPNNWTFATHTLKGSAAAVGAHKLQQLAAGLEAMPLPDDVNVRLLRLKAVMAAAAEFRRAVQDEAATPPGTVVFQAPIS